MTLVLRGKSPRIYAYLLWFLAAATLVASVMNGGIAELLWAMPVSLLIVAIGWAVFWNPRVEVGPGGVRIVNIVREYLVPWSDYYFAENRWGLYIYSRERSQKMSAWGVPTNAGLFSNSWRDRNKTPDDPDAIRWNARERQNMHVDVKFVVDLLTIRVGEIRRSPRLRAELTGQLDEHWPPTTVTKIQVLPIGMVVVLLALTILMFVSN